MTILVERISLPRESKYAGARNLCLILLVWICFVGHELSVVAAAGPVGRSYKGYRAVNELSVTEITQPNARSYAGTSEVNELSVGAAAQPIAGSTTGHSAVKRLSVAPPAQPNTRGYTGTSEVNELSVGAAAQPIAGSTTGDRAVKRLSVAAPAQPIASSYEGFRVVNHELSIEAAAQPLPKSYTVPRPANQEFAVDATAQPLAKRYTGSSAVNHHYQSSGIPTIGKLGPSKTTAAWQLPKGPIKRALIIFEDVNVQPYEFWDHSPSCQQCTGLPEKRKIVMDAIARNYAVFIPHPLDIHGMWEASDSMWQALSPNSPDILDILYILAEWKSVIGLTDDVPNVALGASSGGEILSRLGLLRGYFESIAMMISPGLVEAFESATPDYPPTIFIHMPKDTTTAKMVHYDRKLLSSNGVPTREVRWCEHVMTPYWFAEIIPGLNQATSSEIHRHLGELQWLDDKTGLLNLDSNFQSEWFEKVREWNLFPLDLTEEDLLMFEDRVFEELNVAYAYHVTLARKNNDLFAWFEGGYELQERGVYSPPAPVSLFDAASDSPAPISLFKAASYRPATVSFINSASY